MEFITYFANGLSGALITFIGFLFALMVVVFIHEMGHFLVARWFGVTVTTFSIGFGKEIWAFVDKHGTRWRIAWIPAGGYVKFLDDENAASVPDREAIDQLSEEQKRGAFQLKPVGQRAAVVAAGPIANFLLAIVIFAAFFWAMGVNRIEPRADYVVPSSPAAEAGFKSGDVVLNIGGRKIDDFAELNEIVWTSPGRTLEFLVQRGREELTLKVVPVLQVRNDYIAGKHERPMIGIRYAIEPIVAGVTKDGAAAKAGFEPGDVVVRMAGRDISDFNQLQEIVARSEGRELPVVVSRKGREIALTVTPQLKSPGKKAADPTPRPLIGVLSSGRPVHSKHTFVGPIEAVQLGCERTWGIITGTLSYIGDIFTRGRGADQIGGVVRIADAAGKFASLGFTQLILFTAFISVSIGLINLFPIPILDGGHLVFYAYEAVVGKPVNENVQEFSFRVGLALILMLMMFGFYNDRFILASWMPWSG
ncbi:MAG: RIP metalloprotease RseP [Alphaproteobacteria bacterium]|nr:RIP metalloprotease RseP [Alphaproteobacteria bacterium]